MTAALPTARGDLNPLDLGHTLMHEHVLILSPELVRDFPEVAWNGPREVRIREAVAKLDALADLGIESILDLTVPGLGRSIADIVDVAKATRVNVLVATGYYTMDALPFAIVGRIPQSPASDVLTSMFVKEITIGVGESGVRAAALKCCTDAPGVTPGIDRVLRAVAAAHRETGVPIMTHTKADQRRGLDQQRVFAEEGVNLANVVIGHSGDSTDVDYLRTLMDRGSSIGSDRFGYYVPGAPDLDERVSIIAQLCELGYSDRIVLGHDTHCYADWDVAVAGQAHLAQWNFNHVSNDVLPRLVAHGVAPEHLDAMLIGNPRRLLSAVAAY